MHNCQVFFITDVMMITKMTSLQGEVLLTQGVYDLDQRVRDEMLDRVRSFNDFTPGNDPHREHDFGAFIFREHHIFWKIDTS